MSRIDNVIKLVVSRENKNKYTQSSLREEVFSGYSDCSSLMWKCYQEGADLYIGTWTGEQVDYGVLVKNNFNGRHSLTSEDMKVMKPGDLVFWGYGHNDTRHVEMYLGNNELTGHGSGIGPRRKVATDYYHSCPLVEVRRYIKSETNVSKPKDFVTKSKGKCTGNFVNIRDGASINNRVLGSLFKGDTVELDGNKNGDWVHVFVSDVGVGWVHGDYIDVVKTEPEQEQTQDSKYKRKFVGKCTGNSVSVRTWAGTEYPRIKSHPYLNKGNLVDVLSYDQKDSEGKKWYYVKVKGQYYGFIRSDFIKKNN